MVGVCLHIRRIERRARSLWLLAMAGAVGCLPVQPRLGYPWVESRDLTLRDEQLEIRLLRTAEGARARVHARFHFRALRSLAGLGVGFPEDRRDAALERYELAVDGRPLPTWRRRGGAMRGFLPLEDVPTWHESVLPGLERGRDLVMDVRYEQPLRRGRFRYLLRTGAYWRYPIGRLEVRVQGGPGVRILSAELDEQPLAPRDGQLHWVFEAVEPQGDLLLRFVVSEEVSK